VISRDQIAETERIIRPWIRTTPVVEIAGEDFDLPGVHLIFKLEFLQHAGSFKTRGAFANLLTRSIPTAGVAAASGGNHGLAVAYAAWKLGKRATIFVPSISSPVKVERIRGLGATLVIAGDRYADALAECERWVGESGALPIHAFEQEETLLGQGTVGLELETQAPGLDSLLVACGGGGLIGGIAAWHQGRVRIISVEPEGSPTLAHALTAGRPVDAPTGGIAADSLAPRRVGEMMFRIAQQFIAQSILVSDDAIREAQNRLWGQMRVVVEPGGAVAFAALISGIYRPAAGERTGVLLCGGNTNAVHF
jgi:threonine dehydratase